MISIGHQQPPSAAITMPASQPRLSACWVVRNNPLTKSVRQPTAKPYGSSSITTAGQSAPQLKLMPKTWNRPIASPAAMSTSAWMTATSVRCSSLPPRISPRENGVVARRASVPACFSRVSDSAPPIRVVITTNIASMPGMDCPAPLGTGRPRPATPDFTVIRAGSAISASRRSRADGSISVPTAAARRPRAVPADQVAEEADLRAVQPDIGRQIELRVAARGLLDAQGHLLPGQDPRREIGRHPHQTRGLRAVRGGRRQDLHFEVLAFELPHERAAEPAGVVVHHRQRDQDRPRTAAAEHRGEEEHEQDRHGEHEEERLAGQHEQPRVVQGKVQDTPHAFTSRDRRSSSP